jgi:hypothetical protein
MVVSGMFKICLFALVDESLFQVILPLAGLADTHELLRNSRSKVDFH